MTGRLDDLDDPDYPAFTTGRAAEVLGGTAGIPACPGHRGRDDSAALRRRTPPGVEGRPDKAALSIPVGILRPDSWVSGISSNWSRLDQPRTLYLLTRRQPYQLAEPAGAQRSPVAR
jgi:hypothetical protein